MGQNEYGRSIPLMPMLRQYYFYSAENSLILKEHFLYLFNMIN